MKFKDKISLLLISLTLPLFFYKLGQSSLTSFDEAWYADISRSILNRGDIMNMVWNGNPFWSHPPFGFVLTSISFSLFGLSAYAVRLPEAILGFSSLVVVYFFSRDLSSSRLVGVLSSLALASSPWFLFRARSGNLDITLSFLFIFTLYLAKKSTDNKKFLIPTALSLSFLMLTKSLVSLTILPALVTLFILYRDKFHPKDFFIPLIIVVAVVAPWYINNYLLYGTEYINHTKRVGLKEVGLDTSYLDNLRLTKLYLHSGIGKWFWPGVLSVIFGSVFFRKKLLFMGVFLVSFVAPFIFSPKGQIWHLIPLHPVLVLGFFSVGYLTIRKLFKSNLVPILILTAICIYFSFLQIRRSWYEFIDVPAYISDVEILSREASKYDLDLLIDHDFLPAAIYYSGKNVKRITEYDFDPLFGQREEEFLLIVEKWRLERFGVEESEYEIIKKDRDKLLIKSNNNVE